MPGQVPPVADEREGLLAYLAQQRAVIRLAAFGLSDDQARAVPTKSALSVGGLLKHVATVERGWIEMVQDRYAPGGQDDYETNFRLGGDETLQGVLDMYELVAKETEAVIAGVDDLGQA